MSVLFDAAIFLAIFAVLCAFGLAFSTRSEFGRTFETTLSGIALLLGACSFGFFVCGSLGNFAFPFFVCAIPLFCLAFAIVRRKHIVARLQTFFSRLRDLPRVESLLLLYLAGVFALTFLATLVPPGGGDYDSLVYHLAAPRQYLRAGRIVELRYDHHTYFPFGTEMLFTFGLWLRGPIVAKLFHWLMLPLACGAIVAIARRHLSLRSGLLGAALFASLPVVQSEAPTAYIDLALVAFSLFAFLQFFNWLEDGTDSGLILCGIFCGFCLGSKYLGVLTFGWLGLGVLFFSARQKRFAFKPLLAFCALPILLGGGWYLRNILWTGNPVFPFAYGVFGGRGWTAGMAQRYSIEQAIFGFGHAPLDWLMLPWRLSFSPLGALNGMQPWWPFGRAVSSAQTGLFETPGMALSTILGPALLAFGAPLLFIQSKPRVVNFMLCSFAFFWLFWTLTAHYLRYLLPAFALLCIACGWAIERFLGRSAPLRLATAITFVIWLCITPFLTPYLLFGQVRAALPVILGRQTQDDYLSRNFVGYRAMKWANENTPPTARFAVWGEPRCYHLDRDYFFADSFHNTLIDYEQIKSGDDLVSALRNLRATHVLVNTDPAGTAGVGTAPPQLEQAVASGQVNLIFESRVYKIYALQK